MLFQIKICGVTSENDAVLAADAGATAIGLNFYPQSPRCLTEAMALQISSSLPESVEKIGVFVNASTEDILRINDSLGLNAVQLHGDETPEFLAGLEGLSLIRAFRVGPEGLDPALEYLRRCEQLGCRPEAILLDARSDKDYGGTGRLVDWQSVCASRKQLGEIPLVLAGGLRAENVAEAIATVHPDAVDTASGVESSPGVKDREHVKAFVQAAQEAFSLGDSSR